MVLDGDVGSVLATGLFAFYAQAAEPDDRYTVGAPSSDQQANTVASESGASMRGAYGPDTMFRAASGTSWKPGGRRLPLQERAPVTGIHFRSTEPRSVRANLRIGSDAGRSTAATPCRRTVGGRQ